MPWYSVCTSPLLRHRRLAPAADLRPILLVQGPGQTPSRCRNHTYLFPEKSLSPSNPRIWSAPRRSSSDLINSGAKVPETPLFRKEFDRCRATGCDNWFGDCVVYDEFRKWPLASSNLPGDDTKADFGRGLFWGPGYVAGDGDVRPKGLARFGEPFN